MNKENTSPDTTKEIDQKEQVEKTAEEKPKEKSAKKDTFALDIEEMAKAGLQFGHSASRTNPKMKPYVIGMRGNIHIINLSKTIEKFKEALKFIQKLVLENKIILFVGTKVQTKSLIEKIAKECGFPYVNYRWLGGLITNFETIRSSVEKLKELEERKARKEFEKYTKKEQAKIEKRLEEMNLRLAGIKNLERLPDAVFIADINKDNLALIEARKKKIPVIAITDTNTDPTLVNFPIPANDDSIASVGYILDKIKEAIKSVKANKK